MKFHFRPSRTQPPATAKKRRYTLARLGTPRVYKKKFLERIPEIDLSSLFDTQSVPLLREESKKRGKRSFLAWLGGLFQRSKKRGQRPPKSAAMLGGLLAAAVTVTLISGGGALLPFILRYSGSYITVTVPDLTSLTYSQALNTYGGDFNFAVELTENLGAKAGDIISQAPRGGVTRRLYSKDDKLTLSLTVCKEAEAIFMSELSGMSLRDATLTARNLGMAVNVTEEYSSSVPEGQVIRSSPPAGSPLSTGDTVSLTVSLGKKINYAALPDLIGMSESAAVSHLQRFGFKVESISYSPSQAPVGCVIAQEPPKGASVPSGSAVSLTVSLGESHRSRYVPDLYGMSREEAELELRQCGLVLGGVYSLSEGEGSGVVKQDPSAGTLISSAIVSVDIYLGQ